MRRCSVAAVFVAILVTSRTTQAQEYWDFNWDASASPPSSMFKNVGGSGGSASNGIFSINGSYNARNQEVSSPFNTVAISGGATNSTGVTIEIRLKVYSGQTDRAFGVTWIDGPSGTGAGAVGVWWSTSKVEAGTALNSAGSLSSYSLTTTDAFHTYRIVQAPSSNTVSVYVDDSPAAVISDVSGDIGTYFSPGRLHFGRIGTFTFDSAIVDIDYIKVNRISSVPENITAWDDEWDGTGNSAGGAVNYRRWDSAVDDDWKTFPCSFCLDKPAAGLMTVDRVDAASIGMSGNMWVRDPILSDSAGFTLELGLLMYSDTQADSYNITYLDNGGSLGVHLSNDHIRGGSLDEKAAFGWVAYMMDTTDRYHIYRIVKDAGGHNFNVYIDNCPTSVLNGTGTSDFASSLSNAGLLYPRILIGDNENDAAYNAHYTLDFVRYRRGAIAPTSSVPSLPSRTLPSAPAAEEIWDFTWEGDTANPPSSVFASVAGSGNSTSGGIFTISGSYNARNQQTSSPFNVIGINSASNSTGVSIELSVKVDPTQTDRAFGLTWVDGPSGTGAGASGVWWSAAKIEAGVGLNGSGSLTSYTMDTTSAFHIYRITQAASSNAVNVYVDDNPTAVINGAAGDTLAFLNPGRVHFGRVGTFTLNDAKVNIDYLRVHSGAQAPIWHLAYDGSGMPGSPWIVGGGSSPWTAQRDGTTVLNTLSGASNARIDDTTGSGSLWVDEQAVTVEARVKVLSGSQDSGFNLVVNDNAGSTTLNLSTNKTELQHTYMAPGIGTVDAGFNPGTTGYHIYRLTRGAKGLYWFLYIDNNETPYVSYQHANGELIGFSRIWFGDVGFPYPSNGCNVQIDYIRWAQSYSGPKHLP
jgi:hypothetical protein